MIPTGLWFLILFSEILSSLASDPIFECTNRFEFQDVLMRVLPELHNCSYVRGKYPACKEKLIVAYSDSPPYSFKKDNEAHGFLPGMLDIALETCCHGCTKIEYIYVEKETDKYFVPNVSIVMPQEGAAEATKVFGYDFMHFMEVKGVTFLSQMTQHDANRITWHLFKSVLRTWPLFLIAFLMAITAGCVVWVLDTWFNVEEFPISFPRGPFEGFWWAFVSMTTVGYGDRAPKSVIARVFAMMWILMGITIFSMYTATLTSTLSSNVDYSELDSMVGRKVAVLNYTAAGHSAAAQENAEVKLCGSVHEVLMALSKREVDAIAFDDNIANFHMQEMKVEVPDISQHHRVKMEGNAYGILSYDKSLAKFLGAFVETNHDNLDSMLAHVIAEHKMLFDRAQENKSVLSIFFTSRSRLFDYVIGLLIGLGLVTILLGLSCKLFFKRHKGFLRKCVTCQQSHREASNFQDDIHLESLPNGNSSSLQKQFIRELDLFKDKWINILENHADAELKANDDNKNSTKLL